MKRMRFFYHFLGGVYFAILLIASVALFVIAGTFLESSTQSHRYAAQLIYDSPFFALLLWGFFINILLSAFRRWPFRIKHIPFLLTHFGLLMILGGALAKHYFGLQGTLSVLEGSGSHEIFESDSYAIFLEDREGLSAYYPLQKTLAGGFKKTIMNNGKEFKINLLQYFPHSVERMASWIKGDHLSIQGLHPMPIQEIDEKVEIIESSGKVRFHSNAPPHAIYALRSSDPSSIVAKIYRQHAFIRIGERANGALLVECPLEEALQKPIFWIDNQGSKHLVKMTLNFPFSSIDGFNAPAIEIQFIRNDSPAQHMTVPLDGGQALLNLNKTTPYLGDLPWTVDIVRDPAILFIEDTQKDVHIVTFDDYGQIGSKIIHSDNLGSIFSYQRGFGGYSVRTSLSPIGSFGRIIREEVLLQQISHQLQLAIDKKIQLSPPLQIVYEACLNSGRDFAEIVMDYLKHWANSPRWLYPEEEPLSPRVSSVLEHLDWNSLPAQILQACKWTTLFFRPLEPSLQQGSDFFELLRDKKWPLLSILEAQRPSQGLCTTEESATLLTMLTQQIFAAANLSRLHDDLSFEQSDAQKNALWLSAYFRAHEIHLSSILPQPSVEEMFALLKEYTLKRNLPNIFDPIELETFITPMHKALPQKKKVEDNSPSVVLHVQQERNSQMIALTYDRQGNGLKWPIFQGAYSLRFQPLFREIPYHLRLRSARQINYANSSQPFSFESDLLITDRRTGIQQEKTISMNHVHETWDGYRFYLASMTPSGETDVKHVRIIVNYDPTKYWLTYPGACILSLGIILLFWMRPYQKRKNQNKG